MVARWNPRPLLVVADESHRSPEALAEVLAALEVETEPRYAADAVRTWCNIAVWDATSALGCEVPHWWQGRELNANGMILWLRNEGPARGWMLLGSDETARFAANRGEPVVACWSNPHGGPGHVAMVRPSPSPGPLLCWQAGRHNYESAPIGRCFGNLPVTFYGHR